jgi:CBS domain-containing protein
MTRDVTVATRDMTLDQIAQMMRDEDTGVIPVVEQTNDTASPTATTVATGAATQAAPEGGARRGERTYGKLVGLITDRDIVIRSIADGKNATQVKVEEIMTADVHTAEPNDRVIDAIRKMGDKQVRRIPSATLKETCAASSRWLMSP